MYRSSEPNHDYTLSDMQKRFRKIETDLIEQGIKLYPPTTSGERARTLWRRIKEQLLRGAAVEVTASSLKLKWHREELRRARMVLIDMELIKSRADGRYVLGQLGPFSRIDELIRDQYFDLKLLEDVVIDIVAITRKSKTQERGSPSSASQNWALQIAHRHVATSPDSPALEGQSGPIWRAPRFPLLTPSGHAEPRAKPCAHRKDDRTLLSKTAGPERHNRKRVSLSG